MVGLSASTDSWKQPPTEDDLSRRFKEIKAAGLQRVAIFGGNYDYIAQYKPHLQAFLH